MTGVDFIAAQLALRAWQDGYQEGINGMLGVAFTIRNRVRAGWYGGDWIQVLSHHQEWSATSALPDPYLLPDLRIYSISGFLQEISGVVTGQRDDDITIKRDSLATFKPGALPLALYYGHLDKIDREWFLENISRSPEHKRVSNQGTLTFWS